MRVKRFWCGMTISFIAVFAVLISGTIITGKDTGQQKYRSVKIGNTEMVKLPGGPFVMGSPDYETGRDDDETQHDVTLSPFYIGKYEVTQREYTEIMGTNPSQFEGTNLPVDQISWYEAVSYCNALSAKYGFPPYYSIDGNNVKVNTGNGYRLPTEAEWEYACRGGSTTPFYSGKNFDGSLANFKWINDKKKEIFRRKTTPRGMFKPNDYGLRDMHGNVWEWCGDWYDQEYYKNSPANDPHGPDNGELRVQRGGSWCDSEKKLRSAYRKSMKPVYRFISSGFRIAKSAD